MEEKSKTTTNQFELIANLQLSGSLLAKNRDTLAFQSELNDESSGFIFAPEKKETYNIDELKKAVDVEVVELIPESPETELDLVPRPVYEEALEALADALDTIETQSQTITILESRISELETEVETLKEDVDNEKLLRVLAEENSETLREENLLLSTEVQSALQRSVLEGIEKSSLEARNEGLTAQVEALKDEVTSLQVEIDSLNSVIEGKDAAIEAGAKAGFDLTLLVKNKKVEDGQDLIYRIRNNSALLKEWINGPQVEIYNFTSEALLVTLAATGRGWIKVKGTNSNLANAGYSLTIAANERKTIEFAPDKDDYANVGQDTEYRGTVTFTTKNGVTILRTALQKQTGGSWKDNPKISYN